MYIGIGILVIGVFIGSKYSIEHNLVKPAVRIIFGYIMSVGLMAFAFRLRKNYKLYSAVLLSGSMAIAYFITYMAYSFYDLIPQPAAFGMMVVFTIFTVYSAIRYNMQVIAHIGMIGAYAVPFLLSNDTGRIALFFSYVAVINCGILFISFRRQWKALYYVAFGLTWIIFASWFWVKFDPYVHLGTAVIFAGIFFSIFYAVTLCYKLIRKETFDAGDVTMILVNTAFFYGMGYYALSEHVDGEQYTGLFTAITAFLHFIAAFAIWRTKLSDKQLFWFVSGLVLLFLTIAFPVQMDGNWVTMAWGIEAAILFWVGRTKNNSMYEIFSYPMMAVAFFSVLHDWGMRNFRFGMWNELTTIDVFANKWFFSTLVVIAAYGVIAMINRSPRYTLPKGITPGVQQSVGIIAWSLFIVLGYFTFRFEISTYWDQLYQASAQGVSSVAGEEFTYTAHNEDLKMYKSIWLINYSLLFFSLISLLNLRVVKDVVLGWISLSFNTLTLLIFIFLGLFQISELRESYLMPESAQLFEHTTMHLYIRYISIPFALLTLLVEFFHIRAGFLPKWLRTGFEFLLHYTILHLLSSELLHWMDVTGNDHRSYKLGLSLLWGGYALLLVGLGIWKKKTYLRVSAIVLLSVTLCKLFFYDLVHLPTLSKVVVFVSLGIVLLIIAFLYNKYKQALFGDEETKNRNDETQQPQ